MVLDNSLKNGCNFLYEPCRTENADMTTGTVCHLKNEDQYTLLGQLSTYHSPKPTLTLTSYLGQNDCLGEGNETYDDPETVRKLGRKDIWAWY